MAPAVKKAVRPVPVLYAIHSISNSLNINLSFTRIICILKIRHNNNVTDMIYSKLPPDDSNYKTFKTYISFHNSQTFNRRIICPEINSTQKIEIELLRPRKN